MDNVTAPEPQESAPSIHITPGVEISLQVTGGSRTRARLLGSVPDQYLALRSTASGNEFDGLDYRYGDPMILRYLLDGVVYAFRTMVLNMIRTPEPLVFVSYPRTEIQQHTLRRSERVGCSLPCRLAADGLLTSALVVDISLSGCGCVAHISGSDAETLEGKEVTLLVPRPEGNELGLTGTVRHGERSGEGVRLGIEFGQPQPDFFTEMTHLLRLAG